MVFRFWSKAYLCVFILHIAVLNAYSQTSSISGRVVDRSGNPLAFVSVELLGSMHGTSTDTAGIYQLKAVGSSTQIKFSYVGFKSLVKNIVPGKEQILNVRLDEEDNSLQEVSVKGKKHRSYSNRENPAVELIRQVIAHKHENEAQHYDFLQYQQYERIQFSLSNMPSGIAGKKMLSPYRFVFENIDSTKIQGKTVIPVFMEEKLSDNYYRKDPEKTIQIMKAEKSVDFGKYLDQKGMTVYLNRMYNVVDIYAPNIFIVSNEFLSPLADVAPTFYKYFIQDTITTSDNEKLVEMHFFPRNKTDLLFKGKLWITLDGNYAVKKVELGLSKDINLNWVREMTVTQDFERNPDGRYHLSRNSMKADFGMLPQKGAGIYGERVVYYSDYHVNVPALAEVYQGSTLQSNTSLTKDNQSLLLESKRPDTLSAAEAKVYSNIDSLQRIPSFRHTMSITAAFTSGFKTAGPVEIGPISTFYSFNPLEGTRLRLGGRTTTAFSPRVYLESYGAYGFQDQQWKYLLSAAYAFNNKSIYTFPFHYLKASYQKDTEIPGQQVAFAQSDNFLLSFKRGDNDKWIYSDVLKTDYIHEFSNHFSYSLGFKNWKQRPAGTLEYYTLDEGQKTPVADLTTSELSLELRWAPHEQLFQGKMYRTTIPSKYPIMTLRFVSGLKGVLNSDYSYQNMMLNVSKRFYLSQLGYSDFMVEGMQIFGQLPYPLLTIHNANQSYTYQPYAYNMMNFMEFVTDHYVSLNFEHKFNGFFLNKIPLIRKLKFREIVGLKMLYGGIRSENDPVLHPSLLAYPLNGNDRSSTYSLGNSPYAELNVGLGNIFRIIRLDAVKRLTYLDHPDVVKLGIRASMKFDL
ncbi:: hypothetical protein [Arcticibacter svalbardensis MN12-7]|uniref:TonB-dependent receptor n=1 Tax=Arcticibacter svalbardensis MN12-7 TaxID=1150600 RepID=R9H5K2_9SPHI|nr:DUF5686 and carboxypeptidase-like regulatory domain-containing protein [Arcticibacter svalbardensis]EOR96459.1 : hypothetical protein [Arcticibacter svalbardensis MN12-7]